MKKLYISVFMLIGFSLLVDAQEKSRKELKGDKYTFSYSYDKAITAYTKAKNLTIDGQRKLAESYHKMGNNTQAEEVYAKLVSSSTELPSEDYYTYAMLLKMNGKYNESTSWMDKFATANPTDLRAKSYSNNTMDIKSLELDESKFKILSMDINTDSDDFGTCFYQDKIVFSSTRATLSVSNKKYNWNGEPFLDLYVSKLAGRQLETPENFEKQFNGKLHDGPASFNGDGTFMAFSCNNSKDKSKDKVVELQIYFSSQAEGKWSKPIPFIFNNSSYSVGHPHLTADSSTLYFTSDMPGGFGGADLYKSSKNEKGEWNKPVNLGSKVNTEGEEMFPFFEEKNGILFFTSDGHNGFGGLDIFMCKLDGQNVGKVSNMGFPLNTKNDEYALIVNDSLTSGYFSSDRGQTGFNHIYSVDILKELENGKKIQGIAMDKNGMPITASFITLSDDKMNVLDTMTTQENGLFSFLVDSDKNFKLLGTKTDYIDGKSSPNTIGIEPIIFADLILIKKFKIDSTHLAIGNDLGKVVDDQAIYEGDLKMNVAYFDLDKYNIRPDAAKKLDKIVAIMNDYSTIVIELGSYTDCSGREVYNQTLSDNRAKSSIDYIKSRINNPERISGRGYGETKLLNGCDCKGVFISTCPDKENQLNRRTEFIIMKN